MPKCRTRPVTVGDVTRVLDEIAPPALAQSWDNVGLLVGDRSAPCRSVLFCIDLTHSVLQEAIGSRCDLILAYHPPLFRPISKLLADSSGTDAVVHRAIAAGVAIYSPHTALDAAPGGTNDVLAGLCGLRDIEPFEYVGTGEPRCKLVTFVPPDQLERVASGLFAAGAGRIGDYEQCSFRLVGEGTFFGTEQTNPRLGTRGRLEKVTEIHLEMVTPQRLLPEVVAALRRSHPYEEPAFDLYPLAAEPVAGIGRVGRLGPKKTTLARLARKLKRVTQSKTASIVGDPDTSIGRAAVCVGAAGRLPLEKPRSADCDVIVTGEIRHHDALAILRAGKTAIALGHWESEHSVLAPLAQKVTAQLRSLSVKVSRRDTAPLCPL